MSEREREIERERERVCVCVCEWERNEWEGERYVTKIKVMKAADVNVKNWINQEYSTGRRWLVERNLNNKLLAWTRDRKQEKKVNWSWSAKMWWQAKNDGTQFGWSWLRGPTTTANMWWRNVEQSCTRTTTENEKVICKVCVCRSPPVTVYFSLSKAVN